MPHETIFGDSGHLSDTALLQFQGDHLASDVLLEVDEHLRSCLYCRSHLDQLLVQSGAKISALVALTQAFGREEIPSPVSRLTPSLIGFPSFETIADYVNGTLSSAEKTEFEELFARFPTLVGEVEDLRLIRRQLDSSEDRNSMVVPPMRVSRPTEVQREKSHRSWWQMMAVPLQTLSAAGLTAALLFIFAISPKNRQLLKQTGYQQQLTQTERDNRQLNSANKHLSAQNQHLTTQNQQARNQGQDWESRWESEHKGRIEDARNNALLREREARETAARLEAARRVASSAVAPTPTQVPVTNPTTPLVEPNPQVSRNATDFDSSGVANWREGQLFLSPDLPSELQGTRSGTPIAKMPTSRRTFLIGLSPNLPSNNPAVKRLTTYYQGNRFVHFARAGENPDVELTLGWHDASKVKSGSLIPSPTTSRIGYYLRLVQSQEPLFDKFAPATLDGDVTDEGEALLETTLEKYVVQQKILALSNSSKSGQALLRSTHIRLYRVAAPEAPQRSFDPQMRARTLIESKEKSLFHFGEAMEFRLSNPTNQNLYVIALWLSQDGQITVLPNPKDALTESNTILLKPKRETTFGPYKIVPPAGRETIKFILSTQPIQWNEELDAKVENRNEKSNSATWAAQTFAFSIK